MRMRTPILILILLGASTLLQAAPPTEEALLQQLRQRVLEREVQLQQLYVEHDLEENWASKHLDQEAESAFSLSMEQTRAELNRLEAEINMIKIKQTHGFDLAVSGMIIVFCGLASISVFIGLLPKILEMRDRKTAPLPASAAPVPAAKPANELDEELLTAIALVLHAETERASGQNLKVTLGLNPSPWALSSQMRVLPGRIHS